MPIRATVLTLPEPGHAVLRVADLDASPQGLTLSIERQQGPDSHLADDGWRRTEAWLLPARVERHKGVLEFHLGPEICDRLAGIATVRLRVQEPDIGVVASTVVAWPTMLTSGAANPSSKPFDDTVRLRRALQTPPPEPPKPVEPPQPAPDLRATREPEPVVLEKRSGARTWIMVVLAVVALAGAGVYGYSYFRGRPPETAVAAAPTPVAPPSPAATAEPPKKSIRDSVAEYLATKPTPEAMLAKGQAYAQAGDMAGAFLVWRQAAEAGNVLAQLQIGHFYDPMNPQPKSGFTPDGVRAADWYERAALAGAPDAQRKLGLLFAKGGAGLAADPAKAKSWLQQAAAQNDADAKKALDALPR